MKPSLDSPGHCGRPAPRGGDRGDPRYIWLQLDRVARRSGKSLFLDTLAELFGGNETLFRGLSVHGPTSALLFSRM